MGRDAKFFLAVDEKGAAGCCILATSPEPLRTQILFIHALRDEKGTLGVLLGETLSILKSRRMPDIEAKYVENVHSSALKMTLVENGFSETVRDRMFLEASQTKKVKLQDKRIAVKSASSLLNWRALYLSSTTGETIEESKKLVHSETPYGTIDEDDLTRLVAYDGEQMVGTVGYSTCRNVAYLEKLSVLPSESDRERIAEALVSNAIRLAEKRNCGYIVMDTDAGSAFKNMLNDVGFEVVGQVHYFSKVITLKTTVTKG